jgi:hypothetical protein
MASTPNQPATRQSTCRRRPQLAAILETAVDALASDPDTSMAGSLVARASYAPPLRPLPPARRGRGHHRSRVAEALTRSAPRTRRGPRRAGRMLSASWRAQGATTLVWSTLASAQSTARCTSPWHGSVPNAAKPAGLSTQTHRLDATAVCSSSSMRSRGVTAGTLPADKAEARSHHRHGRLSRRSGAAAATGSRAPTTGRARGSRGRLSELTRTNLGATLTIRRSAGKCDCHRSDA